MKILFIQTGGTIDKDYPKVWQAYTFEITDPAFDRVLERVNPAFEHKSVSALKKDSMDITDEDRGKIAELCMSAPEKHIVITHGTDTMSQTAEALSVIKDKIIVITGAARPERFSNSDAGFNIGVAVGAVQSLPAGVYIAMNGLVSKWDKVKKSSETGQFKSKEA